VKSIKELQQPSARRIERSLGASRNNSDSIFSDGGVSSDTSTTEKYFKNISEVPESVSFLRTLGIYVSSSADGRIAKKLTEDTIKHV